MAGKIEISQVNHIVTMVKDPARAMRFYHDLLGIKQIPSQVSNPKITWLQVGSGTMLHLIETDDAPAWPDGIHHAFQVMDLEATKRILQENGYQIFSEGVRNDGDAYLFTRDPDGHRVELCTGPGYAPAPPRT